MSGNPIFIEIDEKSWEGHLDNIEAWLGEVLTTQATFRQLLEDVGPKLQEPHFRKFVAEVAETARHHERRAEYFYKMIGRDPSAARKLAGPALARARKLGVEAQDSAGGAEGSWRGLHALLPAGLNGPPYGRSIRHPGPSCPNPPGG